MNLFYTFNRKLKDRLFKHFQTITEQQKNEYLRYECVLIDDDRLMRRVWQKRAEQANVRLCTFSSFAHFYKVSIYFSPSVKIFLDSSLGKNEKPGEILGKKLYRLGYHNITLSTGHEPERFDRYRYIKQIITKEPPW